MTTFAQVRQLVERQIIDLPPATQEAIPYLVNQAIRAIQQRHNFKCMEGSQEFVTATGSHLLGTISDWKAPRDNPWLRINPPNERRGPMQWVQTETEVNSLVLPGHTEGKPQLLLPVELDDDGQMHLEVYPLPDGHSAYLDGEYRVVVPYWRYLPPLASDSAANWFTNNATEYLRKKAVSLAYAFNLDDERALMWDQAADRELAELIRADKRARRPRGMVLVPRTGVYKSKFSRGLW